MTEQAQPAQPAEQEQGQVVQVGFGKALMMIEPDWRNKFSPDLINQFRHFYNQGTQDVCLVINAAEQQRQQLINHNLGAIGVTIARTGNEAAIEAAEREAQARAQAEADAQAAEAGEKETPKPKAKKGAKPAAKAPIKSTAKTPKHKK